MPAHVKRVSEALKKRGEVDGPRTVVVPGSTCVRPLRWLRVSCFVAVRSRCDSRILDGPRTDTERLGRRLQDLELLLRLALDRNLRLTAVLKRSVRLSSERRGYRRSPCSLPMLHELRGQQFVSVVEENRGTGTDLRVRAHQGLVTGKRGVAGKGSRRSGKLRECKTNAQTHPHCAAILPLVMLRSLRTTRTCQKGSAGLQPTVNHDSQACTARRPAP